MGDMGLAYQLGRHRAAGCFLLASGCHALAWVACGLAVWVALVLLLSATGRSATMRDEWQSRVQVVAWALVAVCTVVLAVVSAHVTCRLCRPCRNLGKWTGDSALLARCLGLLCLVAGVSSFAFLAESEASEMLSAAEQSWHVNGTAPMGDTLALHLIDHRLDSATWRRFQDHHECCGYSELVGPLATGALCKSLVVLSAANASTCRESFLKSYSGALVHCANAGYASIAIALLMIAIVEVLLAETRDRMRLADALRRRDCSEMSAEEPLLPRSVVLSTSINSE